MQLLPQLGGQAQVSEKPSLKDDIWLNNTGRLYDTRKAMDAQWPESFVFFLKSDNYVIRDKGKWGGIFLLHDIQSYFCIPQGYFFIFFFFQRVGGEQEHQSV